MSPEMEAQLREFWPGNDPIRILADSWGCSNAYISCLAKSLGLPTRSGRSGEIHRLSAGKKFNVRLQQHKYLINEAHKRCISVYALKAILIATIANDKLCAAILDDADEIMVDAA